MQSRPCRFLTTARWGDRVHFVADVVVDASDHSVYLLASAKLREDNPSTVEIRHDSDGYRLILRDTSLHFALQRITADTDRIPVIEVVERVTPNTLDRSKDTLQETSKTLNKLRDVSQATESAANPPSQRSAAMPFSVSVHPADSCRI